MSLTKATYSMINGAPINVLDFGAVGDGTTDDTNAIQDALTYVATKSSVSNGGTVFVPSGRYLIKKPLAIALGTTIQGERSGLVGLGSNPSSGTVFIVSATDQSGATWTTSTLNGTSISGRVLFYMDGGGGVVSLQDFGAIPDNSLGSNAIFFQTGQQAGTDGSISQGFFTGIRPTAFYKGFAGSALEDTNFVDCGFEFNTVAFSIDPNADGSNGAFGYARFTNCVFFGSDYFFNIGASNVVNIMFSSCNFLSSPGIATDAAFNITSNSTNITNCTLASCTVDFTSGTGNKDFFRVIAASPTINGITMAGCAFNQSSVDINYISPTGSFKGINYSGCIFQDSHISVQYETEDLVMSGNTFIGNSSVTMNGVDGFTFGNNSFLQSTATNNVDLSASPNTNYVIVGNLFQSGKGVLQYSSDTDYKIYGNLNQSDEHNP